MIEYECQVCTGCFSSGEITISLDPVFLTSPDTPINMFVHQDDVKKIHKCKGKGAEANVWVTRKIKIPISKIEKLKAHPAVTPGPVATDPEVRLLRDEPIEPPAVSSEG